MPVMVTMTFSLPAASQELLKQAHEWLDSGLQEAVYGEQVPNGDCPGAAMSRVRSSSTGATPSDVTVRLGTVIPDVMTTLVWMASISGGDLHTSGLYTRSSDIDAPEHRGPRLISTS